MRKILVSFTGIIILSSTVYGDGVSMNKIYHPYVQLFEKEIEYRLIHSRNHEHSSDPSTQHALGLGLALSDNHFVELYFKGENNSEEGFDIEAIEAEFKWQLTEQGEFNNDYGLLLELEKELDDNKWESAATLIAVHEWQKWIATINLSLIYEWGHDIDNEFETRGAGQLRYRLKTFIEPAVEFYLDQNTQGVGPVLTGQQRLHDKQKLFWEAGIIMGMNHQTPDLNWKLNIEYEF